MHSPERRGSTFYSSVYDFYSPVYDGIGVRDSACIVACFSHVQTGEVVVTGLDPDEPSILQPLYLVDGDG